MKFTDAPVIELPVRGSVLSLQQDNGSFHFGTSVWPCSLVLVKFAELWAPTSSLPGPPTTNNPYAQILDFRSKRPSSSCRLCGRRYGPLLLGLIDLVLTDISPVMPALKRNLKRNKPVLAKALKHSVLYWINADQIAALRHPYDVVLAADVFYIEEYVGPLVQTMDALLAEDGVVLLGYQVRSPEAHKLFWEMCETVFEIDKVPHQDLHPYYAYEETDVYVLKKRQRKRRASDRVFGKVFASMPCAIS